MIARYSGTCPTCEEKIVADVDEILQNFKDEWVHADCLKFGKLDSEKVRERARRDMCPECFMVHSGECL